jgi:hypothetical protein
MVPVPFKVNTLLPALLQVLEAADECHFQNGCEPHHCSHLNSLNILMSPFF